MQIKIRNQINVEKDRSKKGENPPINCTSIDQFPTHLERASIPCSFTGGQGPEHQDKLQGVSAISHKNRAHFFATCTYF